MRRFIVLSVAGILIAVSGSAAAHVIHVPGDQGSIKEAIDLAAPGDTVMLACGLYAEHGITMKSGVCLTSETGCPECATVDALGQGRVFECDWVDSTASIVGITIAGGHAGLGSGGGMSAVGSSLVIRSVVFRDNSTDGWAGALFCAGVHLEDVEFVGNSSGNLGGAMWCAWSPPTLTDVVFRNNETDGSGGGFHCSWDAPARLRRVSFIGNRANRGGGLFCDEGVSPTLNDVEFIDNTATWGGGMRCLEGSHPVLTDVVFSGNEALNSGGGVYCTDSHPHFGDVLFMDNRAEYNGGAVCGMNAAFTMSDVEFTGNSSTGGGAISLDDSSPTLERTLFWGNSGSFGGDIYCTNMSSPDVRGATFVGSAAGEGGAVYSFGSSSPTLETSIVAFGNGGSAIYCWEGSTTELLCCDVFGNAGGDWVGCIAGQLGINGNTSADPLFCDMQAGDFSLHADSPCTPAANPECGLVGVEGIGCEATSVRVMSWGAIKSLYR